MNQFYRRAQAVAARLDGQGQAKETESQNVELLTDEFRAIYARALQDAESAIIALYSQGGAHIAGTDYALAVRHLLEKHLLQAHEVAADV